MSAKCAYAPTRKSEMYDYSESLQRYRNKLKNFSHATCFKACHSDEAYKRLMMILDAHGDSKESSNEKSDTKESTNAHSNSIRFGLLMPKATNIDSKGLGKVLDPVHVPGPGAPKKRLHAKAKKTRSKGLCGYCKGPKHNRCTCKILEQVFLCLSKYVQI